MGSIVGHGLIPCQQKFYEASQKALTSIGTLMLMNNGNEYVYCQNDATALPVGVLIKSASPIAGHQNLAVVSSKTKGENEIVVTVGATVIDANFYAGGEVIVVTGLGAGHNYKIKYHNRGSANGQMTITLEDVLVENIDNTSKVRLVANLYKKVVIASGTTGKILGLAPINVPANYFFWALKKGIGVGISGVASLAESTPITRMGGTDATGRIRNHDFAVTTPIVGVTIEAISGVGGYGLVDISL